LVTAVPNSRETNFVLGAAQLWPGHRDRPGGGLDRGGTEPVAGAGSRVGYVGAAFVSGSAQELLNFGLNRGLDQQPGTQPGHILDDLGQVPAGAEQRVDLSTDLVGG
jgi:hypothetical protein